MAALSTRAYLVQSGDFYCTPLSAVQLNADERAERLSPVWEGKQKLEASERTTEKGDREVIARGFCLQRYQQITAEEQSFCWQEQLLVVRSLKLAAVQERGLRERLAKAEAEVQGLNARGRHFRSQEELQEAAQAIGQRYRVEGLLTLSYQQQVEQWVVRGYGKHEAEVRVEREVRVEVRIDEAAVEKAIAAFGWQVYATTASIQQFPLDKLVLAYRGEYLSEHDFGRLKGEPCSGPSIWPRPTA